MELFDEELGEIEYEGIDELGSLRGIEFTIGGVTCQKAPRPVDLSEKLLQAAGVRLPNVLPLRQVHVATRKNGQTDVK